MLCRKIFHESICIQDCERSFHIDSARQHSNLMYNAVSLKVADEESYLTYVVIVFNIHGFKNVTKDRLSIAHNNNILLAL